MQTVSWQQQRWRKRRRRNARVIQTEEGRKDVEEDQAREKRKSERACEGVVF
jgi:hypothetical protein